MKKYLSVLLLLTSLLFVSCSSEKYDIVTTSFPGYDAARAVIGEGDLKVKMLLSPGSDIHSYDPSGADIRAINNSKLFIYVGGESDEWVENDVLPNINKDTKVINMFDVLEDKLLLEDGEEDEYDEHVWTSIKNYIAIVNKVCEEIKLIDPQNALKYEENKSEYTMRLSDLCSDLINLVNKTTKPKHVVVADRNPLKYFFNEIGLSYTAALNGCSQDKNVPQQKIIELKNAIEQNELKCVFTIELSDNSIARAVKTEVGNDISSGAYNGPALDIKTLYSMQNISKDDFNKNTTYAIMMEHNLNTLKLLFS